ncbi:hypothetical protein AMAG_10784 [Allomyces macrogynus ATCC 38327]|uniref:Uncharacterized protein n=1 Tax=Allomyces macrogynus (strain ATCC 38327) TaxID=578462 RepID=A0A0L0SRZ5_ALLM3|nr:hypothetical protein AMAG_10784 [Allomyces macrogynus ATCC 38327]|eukprot:KNE65129.1 hypothetical protein AMAG_10784 [Allomyces macrogynus ATCC 38327]
MIRTATLLLLALLAVLAAQAARADTTTGPGATDMPTPTTEVLNPTPTTDEPIPTPSIDAPIGVTAECPYCPMGRCFNCPKENECWYSTDNQQHCRGELCYYKNMRQYCTNGRCWPRRRKKYCETCWTDERGRSHCTR